MTKPSHPEIYDSIGNGYRHLRVPDKRIAARIREAIGKVETVCNVGAGTGSYEPEDCKVTAVEPSKTMIAQRTSSSPIVCCSAEELPFEDNAFDASMAVLTTHHWSNASKGLAEMRRISRRQVVYTFDPEAIGYFWLIRNYLPEIDAFEKERALPMEEYSNSLNVVSVESVPIPFDCTDGFQGAYWRRPEAFLDPIVRTAISTFAQLPSRLIEAAMLKLKLDLESGKWHQDNAEILELEELDLGYRLVVAQ